MRHQFALFTLTCIATLATSRVAIAQCRDGTAPPCETERRAAAERAGNSVAVLYFDNLSRDSADLQLAAAVTEELIEALGADSRLDVRSRYVSRSLVKGDADPISGARAQRIGWIVGGSFRATADSIILRVELTKATTGTVAWAPPAFAQSRAQFAATMSTLARLTAGRIAGTVAQSGIGGRSANLRDPTAYVLYLKGRHECYDYNESALRKAIPLLEHATRVDSLYADAWAMLAACRTLLSDFAPPRPLERVDSEAKRALAIEPNQPTALLALCMVHFYRRDYTSVLDTLAFRAARADPGNSMTPNILTIVSLVRGRTNQAVAYARTIMKLDSLSPLSLNAALFRLGNVGKWDEVIAIRDQLAAKDPVGRAWPSRRRDIAGYRLAQGRCEESLSEAQLLADSLLLLRSLGCVGRKEEARAILELRRARGEVPSAGTWAYLAEPDSMFAALQRAESSSPKSTVFGLMSSRVYDKYRTDPRFRAIVRPAGIELP